MSTNHYQVGYSEPESHFPGTVVLFRAITIRPLNLRLIDVFSVIIDEDQCDRL